MKPTKPKYYKLRHKYYHKHRKYIYDLKLSKKYNKVLIHLKWQLLIKQYKLRSKKKRMTFKFKKALLRANYIHILFLKHNITVKETSSIMIPSKHNPYKTKYI